MNTANPVSEFYTGVVTKEKMEFDQALTNAWQCGVSYEQAIELAPLAALSREEFVTAMNALDYEIEQESR